MCSTSAAAPAPRRCASPSRSAANGSVTGIDLSAPMLAVARAPRARDGLACALHRSRRHRPSLRAEALRSRAVSQFGVMFFADPVAIARECLRGDEGGRPHRLRRAGALHRESVVGAFPKAPPSLCCRRWSRCRPTRPAATPSPIPDRVKSILLRAGFHAPDIQKFDARIHLGDTPEDAASSSIDGGRSPVRSPKWMTRHAKRCAKPSPPVSRGKWVPAAYT